MLFAWKWRMSYFACAIVVLGCLADVARADQVTIFLRDLEGKPLQNAELQAFQQPQGGNPIVGGITASVTVNKGVNSLIGRVRSDSNGMIQVQINLADPLQRMIVFAANRENAGITAMVPFVVIGANNELNHTLHIAVPDALQAPPEEVTCEPCLIFPRCSHSYFRWWRR